MHLNQGVPPLSGILKVIFYFDWILIKILPRILTKGLPKRWRDMQSSWCYSGQERWLTYEVGWFQKIHDDLLTGSSLMRTNRHSVPSLDYLNFVISKYIEKSEYRGVREKISGEGCNFFKSIFLSEMFIFWFRRGGLTLPAGYSHIRFVRCLPIAKSFMYLMTNGCGSSTCRSNP